jgi:YaiO family outer membrane protein
MKILASTIFLICINLYNLYSQDLPNPDNQFQKARELAFSKQYNEARKICYEILKNTENYSDARILLARTFSWEGKYDSARHHLQIALRQDNYNLDAYLALADVETWSQNCNRASELCDSALLKIPHNYDLYIKKIKACLCLEDIKCARATIDSLLKVYPMNLEVQNLLKQTQQGTFKNRLIIEHTFEFYRQPYVRRWHVTSFQYQRDEKWGTLIGKINAGQLIPGSGELFHPGAVQYELDAYPLLGKGFYAYLNYGYSNGELFPKHRAGFELFKTLHKGFEVSLGFRYFYFGKSSDLLIYTGSISKYHKDWWFSFRPYISVDNSDWYQSYFFFARKYSSQYNYIGAMIGYGISPDIFQISSLSYKYVNLDSYQVRLDFQHRLSKHFLFRSLAGLAYDEYGANNDFRIRFNIQLYLAYMF